MDTIKKAASVVKTPLARAEHELEQRLTILWHELQPWQQDNHYIHSGYRPASNSYARSASSLTYLHNETVNIYTHLVGALGALYAGGITLFASFSALRGSWGSAVLPRIAEADTSDVLVFACFFGGAATCLSLSATYHLVSNHSHSVARWGNALDYLGIVALIWGSFVPSIFYGFKDEPGLAKTYWSMITVIGVGCAIVSVKEKFRTPDWRQFRAGMFVTMGLSAILPVCHGLQLYSMDTLERRIGLSWLILQGVLYVLGAAVYAGRIPERWKPGHYDILGNSHQIFHVLVLLAAVSHFIGLTKAFDYWHNHADMSQFIEKW